ncbi:DUF1592 domain-containing protein [Rhodopirellula sp. SWK7]|uniref:DUF1592 domain-containing protein n=1 Tax=Rhodopirellula sp. SWK7 TaxID=595460 RepID=UPI0002BE48BD|nr:DUF1592 domain-containing protein [Rhodopirellula sp. SWK7]EMI47423.1 planctomycete cytochrome C domain protein [Rhodopirellula sp. SWK7]
MPASAPTRRDAHVLGSHRTILRFGTVVAIWVALTGDFATGADAPAQTQAQIAASQWGSRGWPLLETYCIDCHSSDYAEAEVDLSDFKTLDGVQRHSELAVHVISMIRFAAMPPEDAELPETAERRELADLLDALVFHATCDLRPRPGRTTARRLNRAEYNNAIRDLFGVDVRPADTFPSDEVGGGFDNNADVLTLSTMLMDKYLTAAEDVTSQLIVDPDTLVQINKTFAGETLYVVGDTRTGSFGQRYVAPDGFAWFDVEIPVRGEYSIEVRGSSRIASHGAALVAMHTTEGTLRATFELEHRDGRSDEDFDSARITLDAGTHRLFFQRSTTPANQLDELKKTDDWQIGESVSPRFAELSDESLNESRSVDAETLKPERGVNEDEFPIRYRSVVVKGPRASTRSDLPPGQKQLLGRMPERRHNRYVDVEKATRNCLRPLMRRAFRGEVNDDDITPYVNAVKEITDRGDSYYEAIRVAISAVLVSPRFLFRIEVPESDEQRELARSGEAIPLSSNQLASRLSFFLWSSVPDDSLLDAAKRDELTNREKMLRHVRRMLADPKSNSLGSQFARQWFALGNLQNRDLSEFAKFRSSDNADDAGDELAITPAMLSSETEQLFLHLLRENRPVAELLTSERTFVSRPLAQWYGVEFPADAEDREIAAIDISAQGRRGILGHAGVLLLTSYPTRNSPVQRGKWILENVLGTPPPEAPAGVPSLEETDTASADATLREQLELHRADPGCASCHRVMDALGFGLEDYDHFGRLRPEDDPARGDASGELPGGRAFEGAAQLARLLAETEERALADTTVRRMLAFAIGRELRPSDRCFVEAILEETQDQRYRVGDLLEQVILSPPFLNHQAEVPSL